MNSELEKAYQRITALEEQLLEINRIIPAERKYRRFIEKANIIMLELDKNANIRYINKYGLEFFGFTNEELLGKNILETLLPKAERTGRAFGPNARSCFRKPGKF